MNMILVNTGAGPFGQHGIQNGAIGINGPRFLQEHMLLTFVSTFKTKRTTIKMSRLKA
jgi:hypothetical protein